MPRQELHAVTSFIDNISAPIAQPLFSLHD
jgi:hypothetical protein